MAPSLAPRGSVLVAEQIYRLISRTRRHLWSAAAKGLEREGESIFVWQVLCVLDRHGPQTQRDLAYLIAQHPAGISRLLDELERDGLIERQADPDDRRKLRVRNSPKGTAKLIDTTPPVMAEVDNALGALSPSDRHNFRALLQQLLGEGPNAEPQPIVAAAAARKRPVKTAAKTVAAKRPLRAKKP